MDLDSPLYRGVLQKMIVLMRSVIDFLNQLHDEAQNYRNEKINETPLRDAVGIAQTVSLNVVKNTPSHLELEKFVAPEPAKPARPTPAQVWIRYAVPKRKYEFVKERFEMDKPGEIGLAIFNYFFAREIEN